MDDPQTRRTISPLNVERASDPVPPDVAARIAAEREASTEAFHLAMAVAAALLATGVFVNAVGIADLPGRDTASTR